MGGGTFAEVALRVPGDANVAAGTADEVVGLTDGVEADAALTTGARENAGGATDAAAAFATAG